MKCEIMFIITPMNRTIYHTSYRMGYCSTCLAQFMTMDDRADYSGKNVISSIGTSWRSIMAVAVCVIHFNLAFAKNYSSTSLSPFGNENLFY